MGQATVYDAVLGAGENLRQVTRSRYTPNARVITGRVTGGHTPSAYYGHSAAPVYLLESVDIGGLMGLTGFSPSAGMYRTSDTVQIPYQERSAGGKFAGTLSHDVISGTDALIVPTRFAASQQDPGAVAELEVNFISTDGLTAPTSLAINQTLGAQAFNALWGLGPVTVGGTQVTKVTGFAVNTGVQAERRIYDGGAYPSDVYIPSDAPIIPSVDLTFENMSGLNAFSTIFAAGAETICYFRQRADGSTFTSDVSTVHIKFTLSAGIIHPESIDAARGSNAELTLRIFGKALTHSAASAISV